MMRYQEKWTAEVFVIHTIVYGNLTACKIKDQDNKPIKGTFYKQELQLIVGKKTYRIEKVIRRKKEGERVLIYVKRKGYSDKFDGYSFQD